MPTTPTAVVVIENKPQEDEVHSVDSKIPTKGLTTD
jgi:hypothetical protein